MVLGEVGSIFEKKCRIAKKQVGIEIVQRFIISIVGKRCFPHDKRRYKDMIMDRIALILTIIGALNWGSIGLFQFDIVAWLFGGQSTLLSRVIYTVVGLAGIWCISLIFRARESFDRIEE